MGRLSAGGHGAFVQRWTRIRAPTNPPKPRTRALFARDHNERDLDRDLVADGDRPERGRVRLDAEIALLEGYRRVGLEPLRSDAPANREPQGARLSVERQRSRQRAPELAGARRELRGLELPGLEQDPRKSRRVQDLRAASLALDPGDVPGRELRLVIAQGSGGDPHRDPHAVGMIRIPRDLSAPVLRLKVMGVQGRGEESRGEDVDGPAALRGVHGPVGRRALPEENAPGPEREEQERGGEDW